MKINDLKNKMYSRVIESEDINKIDKMINGIMKGKINKENFWDNIGKLTQSVYGYHSIYRWQCLSEYLYEML